MATPDKPAAWVRVPAALLQLALVVTGIGTLAADENRSLLWLLGFDVVAMVYLTLGAVTTWLRVRRPGRFRPVTVSRNPALRWLQGAWLSSYPVLASMLGLASAAQVLLTPDSPDLSDGGDAALTALATRVLGVTGMVLAWLLMHASYGRRYAFEHARAGGGLLFPGPDGEPERKPSDMDFLYFALTVGVSFATSDVNVTTSRMRWHVMVQAIIGFFYNAVVLAVAFRILTGG